MNRESDPILTAIVRTLRHKYRCHTILLYGSRARGQTTPTSDYDVVGVSARGPKTRIARKQDGKYWDVFVYPEKDLRKLGDQHLSWKQARILFCETRYGQQLLRRISALQAKPFRPHPGYEIKILKVWAQKQLERCRRHDIHGLFRRAEFLAALVDHYFMIRQRRFWGPKEGFAWIERYDPTTYRLIKRALKAPTNLSYLRTAASHVYRVSLE